MPELKSIAIALVIMAFIGAGLGFMVKTHNQNRFDEQYGGQAGSVVLGARSFAAANRSKIIADIIAAGGNAVTYTVANSTGTAALQAAGAIDTSLNGTTPTGGRYCLAFRTYNGGTNLQGVLTVVGETSPVSAIDANVVAQTAGTSFTGAVNAAATVVYPGGSQALSAFTGPAACAPGANAFAALITDGDIIGTTTWLCRTPIPNNTSCATMAQNLSLGGNNIASILNETGTGTSQFAQFVATTSISTPIIYHTSDRVLKESPVPIDDPWRLLAPIQGSRWTWKGTGEPDYGVIAQDVEKTMPALVKRNAAGVLQLNSDGLFGPVIAALKDAHRQIQSDHAEIVRLRDAMARRTEAIGAGPSPLLNTTAR